MTSPADVAYPGIGTVIQGGFALTRALNRLIGGGRSPEEQRQIDAAQTAGYRRVPRNNRAVWLDPSGRVSNEREVKRAGAEILRQQTARPAGPTAADRIGNAAPPVVPVIYSPGRDTRAARRRRASGGPGYRPSWWKTHPGWPAYKDCIRRGYDPLECEYLLEARGPLPPVVAVPKPTKLPVPASQRVVSVVRVLGRIGGPLVGVLWPSSTATDDTVPGPMPQPQPAPPRGPSRRPRVGTAPPRTLPDLPPLPGQRPYFPDVFDRPERLPDTVTRPRPGRQPQPEPRPQPRIPSRPAPSPRPTTTPAKPGWPGLLPYVLPLVPSLFPRIPEPSPLTPLLASPVQYPGTQPQPFPVSTRPANCPPCESERKRRRRKCTNPVTRKRTFKRGNATYRTVTRRLEC